MMARRLLLGTRLLQLRSRGSLGLLPRSLTSSPKTPQHSAPQNHVYSTEGGSARKPSGRYSVPNKKDLPYDIVELMEEVEVKTGFLPNVFKVMSHRPAEFRAFFAYYNAIMNKETVFGFLGMELRDDLTW